ncbi:hypothetical protein [Metabacillus halosaccharovorans]|uniref:hypothetical protein n=1 Tax=Metabacillus halosaccharovorans TaxID=930124 RepID=UPI000C803CE9|nr:hypothetical protein [Metabacillus halosaccharovorans]MCM3443628.1 hypothetical protein [Metabacillus halosaccharovorans]PMC36209.1 hypothetical protein CJ195_15455 [Bacillus sp. UMB0899]
MKKIVSALLVSLVASSVISTSPINATELGDSSSNCLKPKTINSEVLYKKEQTKDINKLYKMAENEEGFLSANELEEFTNEEVTLTGDKKTSDGSKAEAQIETLATSELIEVYETDGVKTEVFAVTEFAEVKEEDLISTLAADSDSGTKTDSSVSVRAYSTNNFSRTNNSCIDLTSVTGGWTRLDTSVSIGTKSVNYGATGRNCGTGSGVTQNSKVQYPSGTTYSYAVPSNWVGVNIDADVTVVGHKSVATLTRGSSKWSLSFVNNVTN